MLKYLLDSMLATKWGRATVVLLAVFLAAILLAVICGLGILGFVFFI